MKEQSRILNNIALQILVLMIIAMLPRLITASAISQEGTAADDAGRAESSSLQDVRFSSPDSYYYLRMARDALGEDVGIAAQKQALPVDMLRYAPEGFEIDHEPLLLSQLTAAVYRVSHALGGAKLKAGLEQTALGLSVILPVLVVIPVVLLIRLLMKDLRLEKYSALAAFTAGILSSLGALYLIRSQAGYYDTDCLITAFAAFVIYFFYRVETGRRRLISALMLMLVQGLFSRWWSGHVFYAGVVLGSVALIAAAELAAAYLNSRRFKVAAQGKHQSETVADQQKHMSANHAPASASEWEKHLLVLAAVPAGIVFFGSHYIKIVCNRDQVFLHGFFIEVLKG